MSTTGKNLSPSWRAMVEPASTMFIPVAVLLVGGVQIGYAQPFYLNYDACYVYLLNGLLLIQGYAPGHYDHPGTPVQMFSGLVTGVRWLALAASGQGGKGIVDSVLQDPEGYLRASSQALLTVYAIANLYLGHRVRTATGKVAYALIAQSCPLWLGDQATQIFYLSAEAGTLIVATILLAVLSDRIFRPGEVEGAASTRLAVISGAVCGIGVACKVTFLPLAAILLVLGSRRLGAIAAAALAMACTISIAPVLAVFTESLLFYMRIALHTGTYGSGASGLIDVSALPVRLTALLTQYPDLFAAIAGALSALLWMLRDRLGSDLSRWLAPALVAAALLLAQAGVLALVLKHFGLKYALPALPVAWVLIAWLVRFGLGASGRPLPVAPVLVSLVALGGGGWRTLHTQSELAALHARTSAELAQLDGVLRQYPKRAIIADYTVPLVGHALLFALGYTRYRLAPEALAMRPHQFMWRGGVNMLTQPIGDWFPLSHVSKLQADGYTVLFIAFPHTPIPGLRLTTLGEYGSFRALRVDGLLP